MEIDLTDELTEFLLRRYEGESPLNEALDAYLSLPVFNINENIYDKIENTSLTYNKDVHRIMRLITQFYLTKTFAAMKIDLEDPNVEEVLSDGNIGTPGRIAKMWVGANNKDDSEMMSGRWAKKPRMAAFPNTHKQRLPITKRVDLNAVCSHHAAIFSSFYRPDAYAVVSYIPDEKVLGISKLQRVVDWVARRGWLQEDLTQAIYNEISKVAETESVYVKLNNIVHSCERNRGAQSCDGAFTTEYYGGAFEDPELRKQVLEGF
jgi:GTP cyclohydrolase I